MSSVPHLNAATIASSFEYNDDGLPQASALCSSCTITEGVSSIAHPTATAMPGAFLSAKTREDPVHTTKGRDISNRQTHSSNDDDNESAITNSIGGTAAVDVEAISTANALMPQGQPTIDFEIDFLPLYHDKSSEQFAQRKARLLDEITEIKIAVRNVDSENALTDISLSIEELRKSSESQKVLEWLAENRQVFDELMLIFQKGFEAFSHLKVRGTVMNYPFLEDDSLTCEEKCKRLTAIFEAEAEQIKEDEIDDNNPPAGFEWPQEGLQLITTLTSIEEKVKQFRVKVENEIETYQTRQLSVDPIAREEIGRILKIFAGLKKIVDNLVANVASSEDDTSGILTEIKKFRKTLDNIFRALKSVIEKAKYDEIKKALFVSMDAAAPKRILYDNETLKHAIKLLRQRRLNEHCVCKDLRQLEGLWKAEEKNVLLKSADSQEELDAFVEWYRIDQALTRISVERQLHFNNVMVNSRRGIRNRRAIVSCASTELMAKCSRNEDGHCLNSPLVQVISEQFNHIQAQNFSLAYLSDDKLSSFELNFFDVNNLAVSRVVRMSEDTIDSLQEATTSSPIERFHHQYFLPRIELSKRHDPFTPRVEKMYMLLLMVLVGAARNNEGIAPTSRGSSNNSRRATNSGISQSSIDGNGVSLWRKARHVKDGEPVVTLIVSKDGCILGVAANTNNGSRPDEHGETNALKDYFNRHPGETKLPEGARIFTSLKSCGMCAAAIHEYLHSVEDNSKTNKPVIYVMDDPEQEKTVLWNNQLEVQYGKKVKVDTNKRGEKTIQQEGPECSLDEIYKTHKDSIELNAAKSLNNSIFDVPLSELRNEFFKLLESNPEDELVIYLNEFLDKNDISKTTKKQE